MGRLDVTAPLTWKGFDMKSTQTMEEYLRERMKSTQTMDEYRSAMFLDYQVSRVQVVLVQALADLSGVEGSRSGAARLRRSLEAIGRRLDREAEALSAKLNRQVTG